VAQSAAITYASTTTTALIDSSVFSTTGAGLSKDEPPPPPQTTLTRTTPCHTTHYASNGVRVTIATLDKFRFDALLHDEHSAGFIFHRFTATSPFATIPLSEGGRRILELPNAGGNSVSSEVISYELLRMMFNAQLSRTEMELEYFPHGSKITDYSITLNGECIGVSVTRAMKFRGTFTTRDGVALLSKKLYGVSASTRAVVQERWKKQILHVFAEHEYVAEELGRAFDQLDFETRSNTVVLCTVTLNARWIFTNWY